ncbi:ion channel [Aquimarina litoralis]|uniref:ion channel n=1 Tax=Aquimarina litoralis TaxID=584605 RepID=UPI001C596B0C|nr:ion channel [Aquimarina litoralis]MBW1297736.1 ion transporter [Aquimarina litoralis]
MAKKIKDPGIGLSSDKLAKRFINPDGSFNIKHINRRTSISRSYDYLISISWLQFFCWVFIGYIIVNSIFAIIYVSIGISAITAPTGNLFGDFLKAFFFSAQTVTTVGYGAMAPKGVVFGVISSIEALIGLLSFSFITGLLYGRFSKPKSSIRFSEKMVLRKHNGQDSIMFRLMSRSTNVMIRPKAEVTLALSRKSKNAKYENNFYSLKLERNQITYLPTTWTIVHPITESSPLAEFSREDLPDLHGEILILISYYDESFTQEVHQVHSYVLRDLKIDETFVKAFDYDDEGYTILDHDKISETKTFKSKD